MIHIIASIGRLAREDTYFTPQIHSPDPNISEIKPGLELKFFSFPYSEKLCLSACFVPSTRTVDVRVSPRHEAIFELLRWTGTRSPVTNELGSTTYPCLHYLWQHIQADVLPYASTPVLEREILHLACKVWAQEHAKKTLEATFFELGNFFFKPIKTFRDLSVYCLLSSEELLPVECSMFCLSTSIIPLN